MEEYYIKHKNMYKPVMNNYTKRVVQKLIRESGITRESKVFEVGCGLGRFTLPLAKSNYDLTIMDTNRYYTKANKEFFKGFKNVKIVTDTKNLKNKFDYVIGFNILHHVDIPPFLDDMSILLKKGGTMVFVEPNPLNILYYLHLLTGMTTWKYEKGYSNLTKGKFQKLAKGYKVRIKKFGFIPPPIINYSPGLMMEHIFGGIGIPKVLQLMIIKK